MTFLVLYEELAAYFVKCISVFAEQHNYEVHIIRKEINTEAPFNLNLKGIKTYNRSDYSDEELIQLVNKINPDAILSGGWASKIYLKIVSERKENVPAVLGFDTKWNGSWRQLLGSTVARFRITSKFDSCFVPGDEQKKLALKIGFKPNQITNGAYCCDFDLFHNQFLANKEQKKKQFPHRFIYVGRYVEHKGIKDLWRAFIELQNEESNDWELWCLGTGDVPPVNHPKIKHFGFVQPEDLHKYISDTGVFVLPSHFEPWGVVVHEFAAAGFPIICTDEVGARTAFVENNNNGYIYNSGDINQLKNVLKKMMNHIDKELFTMGENSVAKAKQNTPEIWANKLFALINKQ